MANIWSLKGVPVIPTNGVVNPSGFAVMGAGLAKQASDKHPGLARALGIKLSEKGNYTFWFPDYNVITFPTKGHWKDKSHLAMLETSALQLAEIANKMDHLLFPILVPRVGCGLGGLNWDRQVKPMLQDYLQEELHKGMIRLVD